MSEVAMEQLPAPVWLRWARRGSDGGWRQPTTKVHAVTRATPQGTPVGRQRLRTACGETLEGGDVRVTAMSRGPNPPGRDGCSVCAKALRRLAGVPEDADRARELARELAEELGLALVVVFGMVDGGRSVSFGHADEEHEDAEEMARKAQLVQKVWEDLLSGELQVMTGGQLMQALQGVAQGRPAPGTRSETDDTEEDHAPPPGFTEWQ